MLLIQALHVFTNGHFAVPRWGGSIVTGALSQSAQKLDVNYRTASRYLAELAKGKVLREQHAGKYHFFINKPLLDLLKK